MPDMRVGEGEGVEYLRPTLRGPDSHMRIL